MSTIWIRAHGTGDILLPFRIPERTKLIFSLALEGRGCVPTPIAGELPEGGNTHLPLCEWSVLPNEDPRDWTLQVSTVKNGETLTATLPFSEAMGRRQPVLPLGLVWTRLG